jgi:hypothetical protein
VTNLSPPLGRMGESLDRGEERTSHIGRVGGGKGGQQVAFENEQLASHLRERITVP